MSTNIIKFWRVLVCCLLLGTGAAATPGRSIRVKDISMVRVVPDSLTASLVFRKVDTRASHIDIGEIEDSVERVVSRMRAIAGPVAGITHQKAELWVSPIEYSPGLPSLRTVVSPERIMGYSKLVTLQLANLGQLDQPHAQSVLGRLFDYNLVGDAYVGVIWDLTEGVKNAMLKKVQDQAQELAFCRLRRRVKKGERLDHPVIRSFEVTANSNYPKFFRSITAGQKIEVPTLSFYGHVVAEGEISHPPSQYISAAKQAH